MGRGGTFNDYPEVVEEAGYRVNVPVLNISFRLKVHRQRICLVYFFPSFLSFLPPSLPLPPSPSLYPSLPPSLFLSLLPSTRHYFHKTETYLEGALPHQQVSWSRGPGVLSMISIHRLTRSQQMLALLPHLSHPAPQPGVPRELTQDRKKDVGT